MRERLSLDSTPKHIPFEHSQQPYFPSKRTKPYFLTDLPPQKDHDHTDIVSMVDDYLTRHIEFVKESRSNEMNQLKKIKSCLQQKLNEIKINPEDIPYKRSTYRRPNMSVANPNNSVHYRSIRMQESKPMARSKRASEMVSFQSQIYQCDRLLSDLGVKCKQYAGGMGSSKNRDMRYRMKTQFKRQQKERDNNRLPFLKYRSPTEQAQVYHKRKYDHTDQALLVVPTNMAHQMEDKRSGVPTSRSNSYIPKKSRKPSMDTQKEVLNIRPSSSKKQKQADINQTIEHRMQNKRRYSKTIQVENRENKHKIQPSITSTIQVRCEVPAHSTPKSLIDKSVKQNQKSIQENQKSVQQNEKSIVQKQKSMQENVQNLDTPQDSVTIPLVEVPVSNVQQQQPKLICHESPQQFEKIPEQEIKNQVQIQTKQRSQIQNQSENRSRKSRNSVFQKTPIDQSPSTRERQKSLIPQLNQAKIRGLKLYERIKEYKSKASVK